MHEFEASRRPLPKEQLRLLEYGQRDVAELSRLGVGCDEVLLDSLANDLADVRLEILAALAASSSAT